MPCKILPRDHPLPDDHPLRRGAIAFSVRRPPTPPVPPPEKIDDGTNEPTPPTSPDKTEAN